MKPLYILILAAGQGTRMKSELPKVLHAVSGRPLLEHVLRAAQALNPKDVCVVLGTGRDQVKETLEERGWKKLSYAVQDKQQGSGHAVMMAKSWLRGKKGSLLILYGDTPLLNAMTLRRLVDHHTMSGNASTFLAMDLQEPNGYGRMILDKDGLVEKIVEDKDASPEERQVTLVNSGVACWDISLLLEVLPRIKADNAKKEYYLTDAAALLRGIQQKVGVVRAGDPSETYGVNNRIDLAQAESVMRRRTLEKWMREGVTIIDPDTTYVDETAQLSPDVRLWPGTIIQGASQIGPGCDIGPYTIIEDAIVKAKAKVGPFARLRPGTVIEEEGRVGNFVETKKTKLGKGSKVNHLTYLGDTEIGMGVNIGAGTITCNYDGFSKFKTVIEDGVFVGSNSNLVAPVKLGKGAIIAAGSTITEDVPAQSLAVARTRQMAKDGWAKAFREKQKKTRSHS